MVLPNTKEENLSREKKKAKHFNNNVKRSEAKSDRANGETEKPTVIVKNFTTTFIVINKTNRQRLNIQRIGRQLSIKLN